MFRLQVVNVDDPKSQDSPLSWHTVRSRCHSPQALGFGYPSCVFSLWAANRPQCVLWIFFPISSCLLFSSTKTSIQISLCEFDQIYTLDYTVVVSVIYIVTLSISSTHKKKSVLNMIRPKLILLNPKYFQVVVSNLSIFTAILGKLSNTTNIFFKRESFPKYKKTTRWGLEDNF